MWSVQDEKRYRRRILINVVLMVTLAVLFVVLLALTVADLVLL
jgi:hypothetical protein